MGHRGNVSSNQKACMILVTRMVKVKLSTKKSLFLVDNLGKGRKAYNKASMKEELGKGRKVKQREIRSSLLMFNLKQDKL